MYEVKAIIRPERQDPVVRALHELPDVPGITVSIVQGIGRRHGDEADHDQYGRTTMAKLEIVVSEALVSPVVEAVRRAGKTGRPGDGKIFVSQVQEAVRIRGDDVGESALS